MSPREGNMGLPIREIINAAYRMGATVFRVQRNEHGDLDVRFKFNGVYRQVSLQTIMENQ